MHNNAHNYRSLRSLDIQKLHFWPPVSLIVMHPKDAMNNSESEFPPEVLERISLAHAKRSAVQAEDPIFFAAVSKAMFERDPIGINFADNTDEYDAEAGTVIPRLASCRSAEDVAQVLLEEFRSWFGVETAGDLPAYRALAADIWSLQERRDA